MIYTLILFAVFVGVAALVGGVSMILRGNNEAALDGRLAALTRPRKGGKESREPSILATALNETPGMVERMLSRLGDLPKLFEQANVPLDPVKFLIVSVVTGTLGALAFAFTGLHPGTLPLVAIGCGTLPLLWVLYKRKSRLKKFAAQLPDALELIARALRAGHSLGAGFDLVAQEMSEPINIEFRRTFEEQNLGVSLEESLESLTERVPNLDLKFFATAIILQRQTGGDLAEILDKIGRLIRERFAIRGQVQALTGEGRLSGIVLMALPPLLFVTVYYLNPEYIMVLFTDELGKKMLVSTIVVQLLGALVIRKIVNIKV